MVEKHTDGFALKPLKQKLFVDGLSYLLQEIYGIENKNADNCKVRWQERVLNLCKLIINAYLEYVYQYVSIIFINIHTRTRAIVDTSLNCKSEYL